MKPVEENTSQPAFYTVSEIRRILRIGRNNAYKLVSRNDFPAIHVGNRIIIPVDLFLLWVNKQATGRNGGDKNGR